MGLFDKRGIFSENYLASQARRDIIRSKVLSAMDELRGTTLLNQPINLMDPEEIIATLFILYKDHKLFVEG